MASIKELVSPTTGRKSYKVRWLTPEGQARSKTFQRKGDARAHKALVEADKVRGTYLDPQAGRITFGEYAHAWMGLQTWAASTREANNHHLRKHILPNLGDVRLSQVTPSRVQALVKAWGEVPLAPSTTKQLLGTVRAVLNAAVDDKCIASNPANAASVKAPRVVTPKKVPWPVEQVHAQIEALPDRYALVALLAAGCGLRQGEVFGLAREDVEFLSTERVIHVRRQVVVLGGNRQVFSRPKYERTRIVPLPDPVADALAAHMAAHPPVTVTLPWERRDGAPESADLILTGRERKALNRNYFNSRVWKPALRAAGIPDTRDNGCHALRHFYASAMLHGGGSIVDLSEYLGHHDPAFTLRTYAHMMPNSAQRTRDALASVLAVPSSGSHVQIVSR